jgi:hypothetical protein
MMPAFKLEYNTPNFPRLLGFAQEDRLWSNIAWSTCSIMPGSEFARPAFRDGGRCSRKRGGPYGGRKSALQITLMVWRITLGALVLLAIWAWLGGWIDAYRGGLGRGGWLTAIAIAFIILFVLVSFGVFFVAFHNVFFEPGTWMFEFTDTLIRLFPERFWRDIFIYVGILAGGAGLMIGFLLAKVIGPILNGCAVTTISARLRFERRTALFLAVSESAAVSACQL